ncbi:helix-turn-helix transcriptional regulator [Xylophilus sp. ASV27]|uniref:helix-turn-helix transcriptional regulator n=1 Tax=Xylophilus sp. ASV27 TaxID=2795129 RepID=UPI001E3E9B66|nr:AlpA family phage regulatory protein [Xylophilus sp. ASV27]
MTGFMRLPQVLALVPVSNSTLWRHVAAGTFPAAVKLFFGVTAWRVDDVRHWIQAQGGANPTSHSGESYKRVRATLRTQAAGDTRNADELQRNHARKSACVHAPPNMRNCPVHFCSACPATAFVNSVRAPIYRFQLVTHEGSYQFVSE